MWLALVLLVGNSFTFTLDSESDCDAFSAVNIEYWIQTQQVPSIVMCMPVKEI
jgi:hypothetical protein